MLPNQGVKPAPLWYTWADMYLCLVRMHSDIDVGCPVSMDRCSDYWCRSVSKNVIPASPRQLIRYPGQAVTHQEIDRAAKAG